MQRLRGYIAGFDPVLAMLALALSLLGLVTMYSYVGDDGYFTRQIVWIGVALLAMTAATVPDYRFLRTGVTAFVLYLAMLVLLVLVLFIGEVTLGAQSRFDLGLFSLQPADFAKLVLIVLLAKYFSKRHVEIGHSKHILVSGGYAFLVFALVFIQPDFGSAIIIFAIWLGMVLVSGISFRHLALVAALGTLAFALLWSFGFAEYQKERIRTFLNPLADIQGSGYNAYQSTIAVGSGQLFGKGIGYGTQSKLQFLPEYETDFIFAAFAEEWGLVGVAVLFLLFGLLAWRLLAHAIAGASNFERLFAAGVTVFLLAHFTVHVGMNVGLLPVTGTTVPFLSYGGSHLVVEFLALGMVMGMRKHRRVTQVAEL